MSELDRRSFLTAAGVAGAGLALGTLPVAASRAGVSEAPPNLLVVLVDQQRESVWFPGARSLQGLLPAQSRLRSESVRFERHFTAANACTAARGCLLTGLYAHQTGCMLTPPLPGGPTALDPGFPTWGSLLRQQGYSTKWFGKWHLSDDCQGLEAYGFEGNPCPDPIGIAGQGQRRDPQITTQFERWLADRGEAAPWCATVSLVNPHDIAWFPRFTRAVAGEGSSPSIIRELPANFETPVELIARGKPRLQRALQQAEAVGFGYVPLSGPPARRAFLRLLNLYLELHQRVDRQIGRILKALEARPRVSARTIVVFTSDHGEYGGSHGLRGKGGAAYEEAVRVPLWVRDPSGRVARQVNRPRTQLTSSVDFAPLLLALATGGDAWRRNAAYAHLAGRADLAGILADPQVAGRPYVLHTTDEDGIELRPETPFAGDAPRHIIAYRTAEAKLGTYSRFRDRSLALEAQDRELECYDYGYAAGRLEVRNEARGGSALCERLQAELFGDALPNELRAPLPPPLQAAQQASIDAYLAAKKDG